MNPIRALFQFSRQKLLLIHGILTMLLVPFAADAQPDCTISCAQLMPVCVGNTVTLTAVQAPNLVYQWSVDGSSTSVITFEALTNQSITLTVTDTINQLSCTSLPFEVQVHPAVEINFEQMQLTCTNGDNDNGNTAMVRAIATGQTAPYTYNWNVRPIQIAPGDPSLAIGLKAHLWYHILVTDQFNCLTADSFFTRAYPNPVIEIISTPDTAFIQKPYVTFEFTNKSVDTVQVINQYWEMGDESPRVDMAAPMHTYTEVGDYTAALTVFNQQGCDTVYFKEVKILPIRLSIPNIITPNGDGINDVLIITEGSAEDDEDLKTVAAGDGIRPLSAYYKNGTHHLQQTRSHPV